MALPKHIWPILDTGPLRELIQRRFENQHKFPWGADGIQAVFIPRELKAFEAFLSRYRSRILTTPAVVAEIHRWAQKFEKKCDLGGTFKPSFWSCVRSLFQEFHFMEDMATLQEMSSELVYELGPVDSGLIKIAQNSHSRERPPFIVTIDWRLIDRCHREKIRAGHPNAIIEEILREGMD